MVAPQGGLAWPIPFEEHTKQNPWFKSLTRREQEVRHAVNFATAGAVPMLYLCANRYRHACLFLICL